MIAVRAACPDGWLSVYAHQALSPAALERLLPVLVEAGVALIEQPYPVGPETLLDGLDRPIPTAADESVQTITDVANLVVRVQLMNIKLDSAET